jgi:hypothetical protein
MPPRGDVPRTVRVFHPRAKEAEALLAMLRAAGYRAIYHTTPGAPSVREVQAEGPSAIVIDLSRLPSHGRAVGAWVRGSKGIRNIPLIFVGGDPAKVAAIRREIPDAVYTSHEKLPAALRLAKAPKEPVIPRQAMDTTPGRANAQKLGIREGARVFMIDPPNDYERVVGALPDGVEVVEGPPASVALWFAHDPAEFEAALPKRRALAATSKLWILWPKDRRDGFNGTFVRARALKLGLVDYKICSLNDTWSGMLFAVKKSRK